MRYLKIRQERIEKKWTLKYVGKQVGVSKVAIHDIETGKRKPSYSVLIKLENLFDNQSHRYLLKPIDDAQNPPTPIEGEHRLKAL